MPSICFYATDSDLPLITARLNSEPEIAFLTATGGGRWRAVNSIPAMFGSQSYLLWHVPSGPLRLATQAPRPSTLTASRAAEAIPDPWSGWDDPGWFGSDAPSITGAPDGPWTGIVQLSIRTVGYSVPGAIGLSHFNWVGNHYSIIGFPADPSTKRWWERLRRWMAKSSTQVPRRPGVDDRLLRAWAFPDAWAQISMGRARDAN